MSGTTKQRRARLRRRCSVAVDVWQATAGEAASWGLMYWPPDVQRFALAGGRWPGVVGGRSGVLGDTAPGAPSRQRRAK